MSHTRTLSASISDLVHSLCDENNPQMLLSVIDNLLNEQQNHLTAEDSALRRIMAELAGSIAPLTNDAALSDLLGWLARSATDNHPVATLNALLEQLPPLLGQSTLRSTADSFPKHAYTETPGTPEQVSRTNGCTGLNTALQRRLQDIRSQVEGSSNLLQMLITDLQQKISLDAPEVMQRAMLQSLRRQLEQQTVILENLDHAIKHAEKDDAALETSQPQPALLLPSGIDVLSGLPDRQALINEFRREAGRCDRHELTFSLALLEIDTSQLASQNDIEQAILFYVRDVFRHLRVYDYVSRLSDEHFALLFPQTDVYAAEVIVRRLLEKVTFSQKLLAQAGKTGQIPGFRAGLTPFRPADSFEKTYERSEQALMQATTDITDRPIALLSHFQSI